MSATEKTNLLVRVLQYIQTVMSRVGNGVKFVFAIAFRRSVAANFLMLSFILLTAVGAGMIFLPAGLITAGVTCGLFGYLLGSE